MKSATAWISHPTCLLHDMGEGHPECPARLRVIQDRLAKTGTDFFLQRYSAPAATREQLVRAHAAEYVDRLLAIQPQGRLVHVDPDTSMNDHTVPAALCAAGACVAAVDLVLDDNCNMAFCAVRPPGHHAEYAETMGFCFFNNIAVAAAHALHRGLERVAVLDFDVHYGNGTSRILGRDPRVRVLGTYQRQLFPFWQGGADLPGLIDCPLAPGAGGAEFRAAVKNVWLPALEEFAPEIILVSAGFDAHVQDPLGGLALQVDDFGWIGSVIEKFAARNCRNRVVATLEGGYNLDVLGRCVDAFLQPFVGQVS